MLSYWQAIVFGLVQGVSELFPISSLGHSVVLPKILGWNIHQSDPYFLTFLVGTHLATALVLFFFFWNDWFLIIAGFLRSLRMREIRESDSYAKLAWLLIVGTVPAGLLGLLFEDLLKNLFAQPQFVAFVLLLNGLMLFLAEKLRKKAKERVGKGSDQRLAHISYIQSLKIGILQCLALLPGFSRTGSTITGGLLFGLSHEDAARFSFLLATPVIGAAALLKLPELATKQEIQALGPTIVGAVFAGVAAYLSVRFLLKYFQTEKLTPFAIYCTVIGVVLSLLFLII